MESEITDNIDDTQHTRECGADIDEGPEPYGIRPGPGRRDPDDNNDKPILVQPRNKHDDIATRHYLRILHESLTIAQPEIRDAFKEAWRAYEIVNDMPPCCDCCGENYCALCGRRLD